MRGNRKTLPWFGGSHTSCRSSQKGAGKAFDPIKAATSLDDLKSPPGNRLELLKGNRGGQHSIRINQQYRLCFRWSDQGADQVEITDYH